jgi:peptidoglycan hydrolase-like protein with peptidoglycan-binding domain
MIGGKWITSLLSALVLLLASAPSPKAAPAGPEPQTRRARRPRAQTAPTRARIIEIQQALAREGFYSGKPSGRWDAATSAAMKRFQTANNLTPTGKLGALSLQKLSMGSEVAGKGAPLPKAGTPVISEAALEQPDPDRPEEAAETDPAEEPDGPAPAANNP